jgi:putative ABC transport system permease protein
MDHGVTGKGGFFMLITIAYRNIWRNPRRTIMCISAVALAVFFTIFMQSMINGMIKSIEDVVQIFDSGHVNIVSSSFKDEEEYYPVQYPVANGQNSGELIRDIKTIPGVVNVFPRITAYATLTDSVVKHAILWGINIEDEMSFNTFNLSDRSNGLVSGRFPEPGSNECAVGMYMAKKAGLHIGDRIQLKTMSAQFSDKFWSPEIVGVFEFNYGKYDEDVILVSFDRLQKLFVLGDGTQQLLIFADSARRSRDIVNSLKNSMTKDTVVQEWSDNYWVAFMRQSMIIFVIIMLIFQIVASFLIINTVLMVIHERIKEIGMMASLGLTRKEIVAVFFFEAFLLSIIGSLAGCGIGGILTGIGSHFPLGADLLAGSGIKEFPMASAVFLDFSPLTIFQGFLFGIVVTSICTFVPSTKCAFIEPVEALRR